MPATLTQNSYGKSRVRLTRVTRHAERHDLKEICVDIRLEGAFDASYLHGDNSCIVATDTMKNIVHVCASKHPIACIESFGRALADQFLNDYAHVTSATIDLQEQPWQRITIGGREHPHAFIGGDCARPACTVTRTRQALRIESGLDDLFLLKTTDSGFSGFIRDAYTTLLECEDRIFATVLSARWLFADGPVDHDACRQQVRQALVTAFAGHKSLSVQQTLHAMGEAALAACPPLTEIRLQMPNRHRVPVDLRPFGLDNNNEVFVATDEPYGLITGTLQRTLDG